MSVEVANQSTGQIVYFLNFQIKKELGDIWVMIELAGFDDTL